MVLTLARIDHICVQYGPRAKKNYPATVYWLISNLHGSDEFKDITDIRFLFAQEFLKATALLFQLLVFFRQCLILCDLKRMRLNGNYYLFWINFQHYRIPLKVNIMLDTIIYHNYLFKFCLVQKEITFPNINLILVEMIQRSWFFTLPT